MRPLLAGSVILSLGIFSAVLSWGGAISPHIKWSVNDFFLAAEVDENDVLFTRVRIELENQGPASFTVTDISANIPGLRLLPVGKAEENGAAFIVEGGDTAYQWRRMVITDCAAVPYEPWPIRVTYSTWTGSGVAEVASDSWTMEGPEGSTPVAWQRALTAKICNDAVNQPWF